MKNISILYPKSEFTVNQLQKLSFAGQVSFVESGKENELGELVRIAKGADIIAFPGESIGKRASEWLHEILEKSPNVKGLALNTTHSDYVDINYCNERGIRVFTILDDSSEAVAEHVILLLLGCAKRLFINDRRTYRRQYQPEPGFEIRGQRLGVIGSSLEAQRVMQLAKAIGMIVYAEGRFEGAIRRAFLLSDSDMVTLHLPDTEENKKFLSKEKIAHLKLGAIVINLSGRNLVDERAMAEALKTGKVSQYVFESESMGKSPLEDIETAIMFKPFSGLTHEALKRKNDSWAINIANLAGKSSSYRSL